MFSVERFRRIATIVVNANPDAAGRFGVLCRQLTDLLMNVGVADDGTAAGAWFREESNKPINYAALARQFARIAKSRVPLDHPLCTGDSAPSLLRRDRLSLRSGGANGVCRRQERFLVISYSSRIPLAVKGDVKFKDIPQEILDQFMQHVEHYLVTLVAVSPDHRDRPMQLAGSGTLVRIADMFAILTAAHVWDLARRVQRVFIPFGTKPEFANGRPTNLGAGAREVGSKANVAVHRRAAKADRRHRDKGQPCSHGAP